MMQIFALFLTLLSLVGCVDKINNLNPLAPLTNNLKQLSSPSILLKGDNPLELNQGMTFVDPGFQATDSEGKDISSQVTVTHNVNTAQAGNYSVHYQVSDSQGKQVEVVRLVVVKESQTTEKISNPLPPTGTSNGVIRTIAYPSLGSSPYEYFEYLPKGYDQNPGGTYPLILFLHGAGEKGGVDSNGKHSGAALDSVLKHGPLKRVKAGTQFPAIIVHPQSPVWWNSGTVKKYLDHLKQKYRINLKRIYVTGLSMGGGGTWDFARAYPNEVAAAVPICGASAIGSVDQARPLLSIPIWAFHAKGDPTVTINNSYSFMNNIFQALTNKTDKVTTYYSSSSSTTKTAAIENNAIWMLYEGINPGTSQKKMLTIYPHSSHDSWTETYNNQKMWDWLFAQSR